MQLHVIVYCCVWYCTTLRCSDTAPHYTKLYCIELHCIVLYCTALILEPAAADKSGNLTPQSHIDFCTYVHYAQTLLLTFSPIQILFLSQAADGDGILEQSAFTADESDMAQCDIVGATEEFLRRHMVTLKDLVRKDAGKKSSFKGSGSGKQNQKKEQSASLDSPGIRSAGNKLTTLIVYITVIHSSLCCCTLLFLTPQHVLCDVQVSRL